MVRITPLLARIPTIKFRTSPASQQAGGHAAAGSPGAKPQHSAAQQAQPAAAMSTISDVDLPLRYRRRPMSQEEIDHINGGGIENDLTETSPSSKPRKPVVKLPCTVFVESGKKDERAIHVNIVIGKGNGKN